MEGDAWAMLGVRVLTVEKGSAPGDSRHRHERLVGWLRPLSDRYRKQLAHDAWDALWGGTEDERKRAQQNFASVLDLSGDIRPNPPAKKKPGRPLYQVLKRVRAAIEYMAVEARQDLLGPKYLDLLSRPARVAGPGRGYKKTK